MKQDSTCKMCYRCEYRAQYLELGHAPRYECSQTHTSYYSCYQYRPVKPVILVANNDETRSLDLPAMFAGRAHAVGLAEGDYRVIIVKDGVVRYFKPKIERKTTKKRGKK